MQQREATAIAGAGGFPSVAVTDNGMSVTHVAATSYADYKVIRRNGAVVGFEPAKIAVAMTKAFLAVNGGQGAASARVRELVERLTDSVVAALVRRQPAGGTFHIEDIQDQVELALMRVGRARRRARLRAVPRGAVRRSARKSAASSSTPRRARADR